MKSTIQSYFALSLIVCLVSLNAIQAQVTPAPPTLPAPPVGPTTEITFDEVEFDFGEVESGEIVEHAFTFTNTGDQPLVISNAKGSCGCTVPKWPKAPIAPGEKGEFVVQFNSKNKKGRRNQKVTITANTNPAQTVIYMKGEVLPEEADLSDWGFEVLDVEEFIEKNEEGTELDEVACFSVFPNPTTSTLKLDMKNHIGKEATVSIFSKKGELMEQLNIESIEKLVELDVSHYAAGTYIANLQIKGQKAVSHCFVVSK